MKGESVLIQFKDSDIEEAIFRSSYFPKLKKQVRKNKSFFYASFYLEYNPFEEKHALKKYRGRELSNYATVSVSPNLKEGELNAFLFGDGSLSVDISFRDYFKDLSGIFLKKSSGSLGLWTKYFFEKAS